MVLVVAVVSLSICLAASLKTKLFCETSSVFELDSIKNAAIQQDFLNFWTWQLQNRNNSARPPQFSKLTTSKTKQFCETSGFLQKLAIFHLGWFTKKGPHKSQEYTVFPSFYPSFDDLWGPFLGCQPKWKISIKNPKLSAELTASYQRVLRFFHFTCLEYCACHEKVMPGHTKCCTCHAKSSRQTWRSDAPTCNPSQEISARTS